MECFNPFSMGLLRESVQKETVLGLKYRTQIECGVNLPWAIVDSIMLEKIDKLVRQGKKFIIDGYPRSIEQLNSLEIFLEETHPHFKMNYVYLEAPFSVCMERVLERKICPKCSKIYNQRFTPPKDNEFCHECNLPVTSRKSDTEIIVKKRLKEFRRYAGPILKKIKKKNKFYVINTHRKIDELKKDYRRIKNEII